MNDFEILVTYAMGVVTGVALSIPLLFLVKGLRFVQWMMG